MLLSPLMHDLLFIARLVSLKIYYAHPTPWFFFFSEQNLRSLFVLIMRWVVWPLAVVYD